MPDRLVESLFQSKAFTFAVCCGIWHMSSLGVAVAVIECPNCSKLALFEGRQMETLARTDFSCLNAFHSKQEKGRPEFHQAYQTFLDH